MRTTGGTQGVGRSTIQAVVWASVMIIFSDLLVSILMVSIFSK
jgi:phospholipid/cholesterol/gamma-HCH transport system permease protein